MGHSITAIILKGDCDRNKADSFDLIGKEIGFGLTLFHIDHYYTACWQYKLKTTGQLETANIVSITFPTEIVITELVKQITKEIEPVFAIIQTDYFGGIGSQFANVFINSTNADKHIRTINQALQYLGVSTNKGFDEFDTVGLDKIRSQPEFLEKYVDLAEEYGV